MSAIGVHVGREAARYGFARGALPGGAHILTADRFDAYWAEIQRRGLDAKLAAFDSSPASDDELTLFHDPGYLAELRAACATGQGALDAGPTPAEPHIPAAAAAVAGSVLEAARQMIAGRLRAAFVPIAGFHHAWPDRARQYCVINDCGVLLRWLARHGGARRIAYVDIDVHLGDGVLGGAAADDGLLITDVHQRSGTFWYSRFSKDEPPEPPPLPPHQIAALEPRATDAAFFALWEGQLRAIELHRPDWIVLNAGVDSLHGDRLGGLDLSIEVHRRVVRDLARVGTQRLLVVGGGGYGTDRAARGWADVTEALLAHA